MKIKSRTYSLVFLFLFAALLRFYMLGDNPPSLNADEAAIGYNAYSILKTGRDEYGHFLPLSFRSFDDYKAPLYIYATSLSISLFGLNGFSVRFISAVAGTLTVVFTYLLLEIMINESSADATVKRTSATQVKPWSYVPIMSSLLLAVSPWHLHFSRSAYEANVSVFFIVLGLFLFFKGLHNKSWLLWSGMPFIFSMWTYHTPRVFVPLLVLALFILYRQNLMKAKEEVFFSAAVSLLLFIPLVALTLSPTGLVRAKGISSLQNPAILERSVKWIGYDSDVFLSRTIHNRRIEYGREIVKGYLEHLNPVFLFMDRAEEKYRAPGVGLMYLWELPFLIAGFYTVAVRKSLWSKLLVSWLVLAPVAAAPTLWLPSPIRTIVMLPVLQIFTGFGLAAALNYLMLQLKYIRYFTLGIIFITATVSVYYYIHQYYVHLPIDNAADWQFGRKEVVNEVQRLENNYEKIVVSPSLDQPQIFFLYYLAYDPAAYLREGGTISGKFDAQDNHFSKYFFSPPEKFVSEKSNILFVATAEEVPKDTKIISEILYPDGSQAFVLYET